MNKQRELIEEIREIYAGGQSLSQREILEKIKGVDGFAPCLDCGRETIHTDYYMLKHDLWAAVVPESVPMCAEARKDYPIGDGCFLCLDCLEIRIGRDLEKSDFISVPFTSELESARWIKPSRIF